MDISKIHNRLKSLKDEKIGLIHHTDPDGICSGVIISKAIERLRGKPIDFRINQKGNEIEIKDKTIDILREKGINLVIIVDLGTDQYPEQIKKITEFAEVLIFDHHKMYNDINSDKICLMKPLMFFKAKDPSQYCAAKFVYDICKEIVDIEDLDWVKTIGLIGDCGFKEFPDEIDEILKKYDIEKKGNYFQNKLGQCAQMISSAESFGEDKIGEVFEIVSNAKTYKDILNSEILQKYRNEIREDVEKCIKDFENAEKKGDIFLYKIESKYFIKSKISTMLSFKYQDKTIIIAQEMGDKITLSARRQDGRVKVNELLEKAVKGYGTAGGHTPAAGGTINKEDWSKFRKIILDIN